MSAYQSIRCNDGWPGHVQSSDDENLMEQFQAGGMPLPHGRAGLQPSSSTPALPTHLARMSETADANADYARGSHT